MHGQKILVLLTSLTRGGAEQVALRLAADWAAQGAEVTLATLLATDNPMQLPAGAAHVPLHHPGDSGGPATRLIGTLACLRRLRRLIRKIRPDVFVAHVDRTNVMALLANTGLATPIIVVEHNHPIHHPIGRAWNMLRWRTYPSATHIVGVSQGVIDALPPPCRPRALAIPNWIDPPSPDHPQPAIGSHRIVAMGRLVPQKGFDILIEAFSHVIARRPGATLTIWGRGDSQPLEQQAAMLGIAKSVTFAGFTDDPRAALLSGHVLAFPSRYEGFGLALGEAMALGLPVVAANCEAGPGELIRDGIDGLLVPPEDPTALATALLRLIDDADLALGLGANARDVTRRFSFERARTSWAELIARCTGGLPPT